MSTLYPAATLAKLFQLTERRVQQLAKDGIIPKAEKGRYDLAGSVRGYIRYLQERAAGRLDGSYQETTDLLQERKRLIKAQADKTESEHQKLRGELIPFTLVEETLNEVAVLFASSVDALPGRLANELAGLSDPALIKTRLFEECRRLRLTTSERLSRWAATLESPETRRLDGDGTALTHTGSMGG
jgi:phage terminase Nu1 subunit (DNA packaging protein)